MEQNENVVGKKVYEIGFLFVPTIADVALAEEFGTLKSKIEAVGGVAIAEEFPVLIDLSYEMAKTIANKKTKFVQAYFGWIKFEIEADKINAVKVYADGSDKIIRSLIISTVRENTVVGKKFMPKTDRKRAPVRKSTEKKSETPLAEEASEELDEKIDGLVTE